MKRTRSRLHRKIWVNKANSFDEAERFDALYYMSMSASERIDTMQLLRDIYYTKFKRAKHESRKRLRRVIRIIQQA